MGQRDVNVPKDVQRFYFLCVLGVPEVYFGDGWDTVQYMNACGTHSFRSDTYYYTVGSSG